VIERAKYAEAEKERLELESQREGNRAKTLRLEEDLGQAHAALEQIAELESGSALETRLASQVISLSLLASLSLSPFSPVFSSPTFLSSHLLLPLRCHVHSTLVHHLQVNPPVNGVPVTLIPSPPGRVEVRLLILEA
jgi:hypothetical protein